MPRTKVTRTENGGNGNRIVHDDSDHGLVEGHGPWTIEYPSHGISGYPEIVSVTRRAAFGDDDPYHLWDEVKAIRAKTGVPFEKPKKPAHLGELDDDSSGGGNGGGMGGGDNGGPRIVNVTRSEGPGGNDRGGSHVDGFIHEGDGLYTREDIWVANKDHSGDFSSNHLDIIREIFGNFDIASLFDDSDGPHFV